MRLGATRDWQNSSSWDRRSAIYRQWSHYTGEAECFAEPGYRTAVIYSGLDKWGLHG